MRNGSETGRGRSFRVTLLLAAVLLALNVSGQNTRKSKVKRTVRILFIGNSLTYTNSLPKIFAELYKKTTKNKLDIEILAEPNFGLEDHWSKGKALSLLERKSWDFVVLQQGPSASKEGRESLLRYSKIFLPAIQKAGGKPVLYMVWPSVERFTDMDNVAKSYAAAAAEVDAILAPAGCAWADVLSKGNKIKLYSGDGFHPSPAGSYLAALSILRSITGSVPERLPTAFLTNPEEVIEISDAEAKAFMAAVDLGTETCGKLKE